MLQECFINLYGFQKFSPISIRGKKSLLLEIHHFSLCDKNLHSMGVCVENHNCFTGACCITGSDGSLIFLAYKDLCITGSLGINE